MNRLGVVFVGVCAALIFVSGRVAAEDAASEAETPKAMAASGPAPTPPEQPQGKAEDPAVGKDFTAAVSGPTGTSNSDASAAPSKTQPAAEPPPPKKLTEADIPVDGSTFQVRLRTLGASVDETKEHVRRSKQRLRLLDGTLLSAARKVPTTIHFRDRLSNIYRIKRVLIVFDGIVEHDGPLNKKRLENGSLLVLEESITQGPHRVQVLLELEGTGFGVFSYKREERFRLRSSHTFEAEVGQAVALDIVVAEHAEVAQVLESRPRIDYVKHERRELKIVHYELPAPEKSPMPVAQTGSARSKPLPPLPEITAAEAPTASADQTPEQRQAAAREERIREQQKKETEAFKNFSRKVGTSRQIEGGFEVGDSAPPLQQQKRRGGRSSTR